MVHRNVPDTDTRKHVSIRIVSVLTNHEISGCWINSLSGNSFLCKCKQPTPSKPFRIGFKVIPDMSLNLHNINKFYLNTMRFVREQQKISFILVCKQETHMQIHPQRTQCIWFSPLVNTYFDFQTPPAHTPPQFYGTARNICGNIALKNSPWIY